MPTLKQRVKQETSLPKITLSGHLKETELTNRGSLVKHPKYGVVYVGGNFKKKNKSAFCGN